MMLAWMWVDPCTLVKAVQLNTLTQFVVSFLGKCRRSVMCFVQSFVHASPFAVEF